jgi:hypothetical protein
MKLKKAKLLPIPSLKGNIHVTGGSPDDNPPEVVIQGDPEGLRSLAAVLCALAEIDQTRLADLPPEGAHEHLHLEIGRHLGENSARLIVGRLDDQQGNLPEDYGKRLKKARPIREWRKIKKD